METLTELELKVLDHQEISFTQTLYRALNSNSAVAHVFTIPMVMLSGLGSYLSLIVSDTAQLGLVFYISGFAMGMFVLSIAFFVRSEFKNARIMGLVSLITTMLSVLMINMSVDDPSFLLGSVAALAILVGSVVAFLIRIKINARRSLERFNTDEHHRLTCLQKYLSKVVIPEGQEEISALNAQLECKLREYKNQLDLDLAQVNAALRSENYNSVERASLERMKDIINQKLEEPSPELQKLQQAKTCAQEKQEELVQLNKDLLLQIKGPFPRDVRSLLEKYLPEEHTFSTPSVGVWESFIQRYRAITDKQTIVIDQASRIVGYERQLTNGTPIQRLLDA